MAETVKVTIIGGGMGGLAAAWKLSRQSNPQVNYEITLYQRGWRLGGKGSSGASIDPRWEDGRIEEHGLHILMGFYDQVFEILEDCYRDVRDSNLAKLPPLWETGEEASALDGRNSISVAAPIDGDWDIWDTDLPELRPLPPGISPVRHALNQLGKWVRDLRVRVVQLTGKADPYQMQTNDMPSEVAGLLSASYEDRIVIADRLRTTFETAWDDSKDVIAASVPLRQTLSLLYLATTIPVGLVIDRILDEYPDFSRIDGTDFKVWLENHGIPTRGSRYAEEVSWDSPYVRALYDLSFGLETTIAAGIACNHVIQLLFGWRTNLYFKMNGGMGDVVFAPLYLALAKRGVTFRFFHRATKLSIDPERRAVVGIKLERQVDGLTGYSPLLENTTTGMMMWPNEPLFDQLPERYQRERKELERMPHDFETEFPSPYAAVQDLDLVVGTNFHVVVLAVSLGGLKEGPLCEELRSTSPTFATMVSNLRTCPTQAFQLWLKPPMFGAKWESGTNLAGYAEPFTACTDMNQVIGHEQWMSATPPQTLGYFCGAFRDAPADKVEAVRIVGENAKEWLAQHAHRLMSGVAEPGKFDWSQVMPNGRGFYARANVDPSDQYVLSEKGMTSFRLDPGESGFVNLKFAGDWVLNSLNSGCVESAARGGVLAADSILGIESTDGSRRSDPIRQPVPTGQSYVETDGDWVVRPPGILEGVTMHIFFVSAKRERLAAVCDQLINRPSAGKITADPISPSVVMFVFAEIPRGYPTETPSDGVQPENDLSIFLPVTLKVDGKRRGVSFLLPYIFVDNPTGMSTGREVYGFPKQMATIDIARDHSSFKVCSATRPTAEDYVEIKDDVVAHLTAQYFDVETVTGNLWDPATNLFTRLGTALGVQLPKVPLAEISQVFLKQFRDAADPTVACHQSIVEARAQISLPVKPTVRTGRYQLYLPAYDKPRIAETLGLGLVPDVKSVSLRIQMDFTLPRGTTLWKAP